MRTNNMMKVKGGRIFWGNDELWMGTYIKEK